MPNLPPSSVHDRLATTLTAHGVTDATAKRAYDGPSRRSDQTPVLLQARVDDIRTGVVGASCDTALERECLIFRSLADIVSAAPVESGVLERIYDVRRTCLKYFTLLERGRRSAAAQKAVLISLDFLELALLDGAGRARPYAGRA